MAGLSTLRAPSLCRHGHRKCMRSAWLDVTPIIPATACHQRNNVERYSRYKKRRGLHVDLRGRDFAFRKVTRPRPSMLETTQRHDYQRDHEQEAEHKGIDPVTHRAAFPG